MIPHLFYYQLVILGLLWLFVMLHSAWPSRGAPVQGTSAQPIKPRRQRSKELKPFAGLTHKPFCAACEHDSTLPQPSPRMVKKLMRLRARSILGLPRAVHDTALNLHVL